MKKIPPTR